MLTLELAVLLPGCEGPLHGCFLHLEDAVLCHHPAQPTSASSMALPSCITGLQQASRTAVMTASAAAVLRDVEAIASLSKVGLKSYNGQPIIMRGAHINTAIGLGPPLSAAVQHYVCDHCISDHYRQKKSSNAPCRAPQLCSPQATRGMPCPWSCFARGLCSSPPPYAFLTAIGSAQPSHGKQLPPSCEIQM